MKIMQSMQPGILRVIILMSLVLCGGIALAQSEQRTRRSTRTNIASSSAVAGAHALVAAGTTSVSQETSISARASRMHAVNEAEEIASATTTTALASDGDLLIGYKLAEPGGYYDFDGSTLSWHQPASSDTHYLAVTVQDAGDKRVIPGCKVAATLTDASGKDTSVTLQETWDPHFRHYGSNVAAPSTHSTGTLLVKVEPPSVRRRDKALGAFFTSAATHTFRNVDLSTASLGIRAPKSEEPESPIWPKGRRPFSPPVRQPGR